MSAKSKVFVSHSHAEKLIARRVAWRLAAYGISAWMDEHGLRKGEALEAGVKRAIDTTDAVIVIATKNATRSPWVRKEMAYATARRKSLAIYPFFVDDVKKRKLFKTHLGIDATDSHLIEQRVFELAKELGASCSPLSVPNVERLREALDSLKMEGSAVGLLIDGILHGAGLPKQQAQTVVEVPFHVLDFALNALYDIVEGSAKDAVANLSAWYFRCAGPGDYVLERYLVSNRCSAEANTATLADAVGGPLASNHLDEALRLLSISEPPNDRALRGFVKANNGTLSNEQWGKVIRLVTSPVRRPGNFTQEAVFEVLNHKPDNESVRLLIEGWIIDGHLDRSDPGYELRLERSDPHYELRLFASLMTKAHRLSCYEQIAQHWVRHIRELVRSGDGDKVRFAINHLRAAADNKCPCTADIARKCMEAEVSAKWQDLKDEAKLSFYVSAYVRAALKVTALKDPALKDREWRGAQNEYERKWKELRAGMGSGPNQSSR